MMVKKESLCSIIIELPKKENDYLKTITEKVSRRINLDENRDNFHLTIEPTLQCDKSFRTNLNRWLEMQNSFELTLNKIDLFENRKGGLIYLTTTDQDERDRISDLHYGIHETIKSLNPTEQNNSIFIPHVTLLSAIPPENIEEIKSVFIEEIYPIKIYISEVLVRKKTDDRKWTDFGKFKLGTDDWSSFNLSYQSCRDQVI